MGGKRDRWAGSISELSAKEKERSERVLTKSKKMTHTHTDNKVPRGLSHRLK